MTVIPLNCWSEADESAIREHLDRVLNSGPFQQSQRRRRFLEYLVNETLAGRGKRLKAYNVALAVFDRPETFDPLIDPVVRVEAGRLREKLRDYYDTDGQSDRIRIELPKGTYVPRIEFRHAGAPDAASVAVDGEPYIETLSKLSHRWRQIGMSAAAAFIVLAAASVWGLSGRTPAPAFDKPSIAVLPFDNIGDDPKWQRFASGITEDIITDLSHSKDLIVIARNSTRFTRARP